MSRRSYESERHARWRRRLIAEAHATPGPPRKEDAACCVAKRDDLGRLQPGFCGPDCVRRLHSRRAVA